MYKLIIIYRADEYRAGMKLTRQEEHEGFQPELQAIFNRARTDKDYLDHQVYPIRWR